MPRPRFSLRSLVLFTLLLASVGALYLNRDPWRESIILKQSDRKWIPPVEASTQTDLQPQPRRSVSQPKLITPPPVQKVNVWEEPSGKLLHTLEIPSDCTAVQLAGDNHLVLQREKRVDLVTMAGELRFTLAPKAAPRCTLSLNERWLVILDGYHTLLIDTENWKTVFTGKSPEWPRKAFITPDSRWLAVLEVDSIRVMDLALPQPAFVKSVEFERPYPVQHVRMFPASPPQMLYMQHNRIEDRYSLMIWNSSTESQTRVGGILTEIHSLSGSRWLLVCDNSIAVWNSASATKEWQTDLPDSRFDPQRSHSGLLLFKTYSRRTTGDFGLWAEIVDEKTGQHIQRFQETVDGIRKTARGYELLQRKDPNQYSTIAGTVVRNLWLLGDDEPRYVTNKFLRFGADETKMEGYSRDEETIYEYTRVRPEEWWGLIWLPEFWLTTILTILFTANLLRPTKAPVQRKTSRPQSRS